MARTDLTTADLQPGDLVFTKINDLSNATHVEIFTGSSHFAATSVHAVNNAEKQMQRVMGTSFAQSDSKVVFRCNDAALAKAAAKRAVRWSAYENRYDKDRIDVKTAFREMHRNLHTGDADLRAEMRRLFNERGRFRAIKYAARRDGILCYPGDQEGNGGRGMTCCMFAVTCYQAAALTPFVQALGQSSPFMHVSDKKMDATDLAELKGIMKRNGFATKDYQQYTTYVGCIQAQNEYAIDWGVARKPEVQKGAPAAKWVGYTYVPSILMWSDPPSFRGFDWEATLTSGMCLDAKIAAPQNVFESLEADATMWTFVGRFANALAAAPTDAQKAAYQAGLAQNKKAGEQMRKDWTQKTPQRFQR
jgi:hypothetical protein